MKRTLAWLVVFMAVAPAWAQDAAAPVQTVRLTPRESGFHKPVPEIPWGGSFASDYTFQVEPEQVSKDAIRTSVMLSRPEGGPLNKAESIGLIWDIRRSVAYVDANRNRDLTDDGPVFPVAQQGRGLWEARGVRLNVKGPNGIAWPYILDLRLAQWSRDYRVCDAVVHSGWEGRVTLDGETWIIGLAGNLDDKLDKFDSLLLYREDRGAVEPELRQTMYAVPAENRLCINGKTYDLAYAFDGPDVLVTLQEISVPMGPLQIANGQAVERVILHGDVETVLDKPHGTVSAPKGIYNEYEVFLYDPPSGACFQQAGRALLVQRDQAARLVCGGPLENRVTIGRDGPRLVFFHEAKWSDGEAYYRLDRPAGLPLGERRDPPTFAVYSNGEQVASGRFEYG